MPPSLAVRPARREDAEVLAGMLEIFTVEDGSALGAFTREKVLDHRFGPDPACGCRTSGWRPSAAATEAGAG